MASPLNQSNPSIYLPLQPNVPSTIPSSTVFSSSPFNNYSGFTSPIKATERYGLGTAVGDETVSTMANTPLNFSGIANHPFQNTHSFASLSVDATPNNAAVNPVAPLPLIKPLSRMESTSSMTPAAAAHHLQQYKIAQQQQQRTSVYSSLSHPVMTPSHINTSNLSTTDTLGSLTPPSKQQSCRDNFPSGPSFIPTTASLITPSSTHLPSSILSPLQPLAHQYQQSSPIPSSSSLAWTTSASMTPASSTTVTSHLRTLGSTESQTAMSTASLTPVVEEEETPHRDKKLSKKTTTEGKVKKGKKSKKGETVKKSKSINSRPPLASGAATPQSSNGSPQSTADQTPTATTVTVHDPALVRLAAAVQANAAGIIEQSSTGMIQQQGTVIRESTMTYNQQSVTGQVSGMAGMHMTTSSTPMASGTIFHHIADGEGTTLSVKTGGFTSTGQRILSERVIEREVKVPKRVRVEETIEHLETRSEVVFREEIVEGTHKYKEHIREVKKPVIKEKIVEVPEIEYIDKVVEVAQNVTQHKIVERPSVQVHERVVEVPKLIQQERIVEVVELQYRDVPVERIVEVPEIHEEITIVEKRVPQVITRELPQYNDILIDRVVDRRIPVPMEHVTEVDFDLPIIEPVYINVDVPIYVPRFIEIACPVEAMDNASLAEIQAYADRMSSLSLQSAMTLTDVERLAETLRQVDPVTFMKTTNETDVIEKLVASWRAGLTEIQHTQVLKPNVQSGYSEVTRQSSAPAGFHHLYHQGSLLLSPGRTTVDLISGAHVTRLPKRAISHSITSTAHRVDPNPLMTTTHQISAATHLSTEASVQLLRNSLPPQLTNYSVLNLPTLLAKEPVPTDRERTPTVESAAFTSLNSEPIIAERPSDEHDFVQQHQEIDAQEDPQEH